jgi:hypothetical protein
MNVQIQSRCTFYIAATSSSSRQTAPRPTSVQQRRPFADTDGSNAFCHDAPLAP